MMGLWATYIIFELNECFCCRDDFRKEYKEANPDSKSVSAEDILLPPFIPSLGSVYALVYWIWNFLFDLYTKGCKGRGWEVEIHDRWSEQHVLLFISFSSVKCYSVIRVLMCSDFVTISNPGKEALLGEILGTEGRVCESFGKIQCWKWRGICIFDDGSNCYILGVLVHGSTYHVLFISCRIKWSLMERTRSIGLGVLSNGVTMQTLFSKCTCFESQDYQFPFSIPNLFNCHI